MGRSKSKQPRLAGNRTNTPGQITGVPLPIDVVSLQRNDYLAAALAALIALTVYLSTLATTLTGDDSGEFIAAAYTLGVAHPPGYPLWCMLGKLFTIILPFSTIAWRVAFVSSFFGIATCYVVCLIVIKLTANRMAGVAAAAALAFSLEFWKWNVVAETYSLNAFLMVLGMLFLLRWYETRQDRFLYWFAIVYGLGLCNHHTTHFMGPMFALFILSMDRRPWLHWRTYLYVAIIAVLVWGVIHLYLPIRATANPYCNWGDPRTLGRFWAVITRQVYQSGFVAEPRTFARFLDQCRLFFTQYKLQFTPWTAWLPLLGVYPLWRRNRYVAAFVCGSFVYIALGLILIINSNFDRASIWLNSKFWIPAYVMASILIGVAIAWIASLKRGAFPLKASAVVLAGAAIVLPLLTHYKANDRSKYTFAYDYARNLAKTLDKDALFFPSNDHAYFAVFYLQAVEKSRLDITIATKFSYIEESLKGILSPKLQELTGPGICPTILQRIIVGNWIVRNTNRPVYYGIKCPNPGDLQGVKMVEAGFLFRMVSNNWQPPERDCWSEYEWATLEEADIHGDYTAETVVSNYHFAYARRCFASGDTERGMVELEAAIRVGRQDAALIINIGTMCGEYNMMELAKACFLTVLDTNPDHREALSNLAVAYSCEGDSVNAADAFQRLVNLDESKYGKDHPLVALSLNNLGGVYLNLGHIEEAHKCFARCYEIDLARYGINHHCTGRDVNNLGVIFRRQGDLEQAEKCRRQAVDILSKTLGPNHPFTELARQGRFIESLEN